MPDAPDVRRVRLSPPPERPGWARIAAIAALTFALLILAGYFAARFRPDWVLVFAFLLAAGVAGLRLVRLVRAILADRAASTAPDDACPQRRSTT